MSDWFAFQQHCGTCSCRPRLPSAFVSDVRMLPVDFEREVTFTRHRGAPLTMAALNCVHWRPDRHFLISRRLATYELLITEGIARNIREAVKFLAVKRREAERKEIAERADQLRRKYVGRLDARTRALPRKKDLVRLAAGEICFYCGAPGSRHVDHVIPTSRGGDHRRRNLVCACGTCNREKGARTPGEWKAARLAAGLSWPPSPSGQDSDSPPGLTTVRLSQRQTDVLRIVQDGNLLRAELDGHGYRALRCLEQRGLIERGAESLWGYVLTGRGALALETGRVPCEPPRRPDRLVRGLANTKGGRSPLADLPAKGTR